MGSASTCAERRHWVAEVGCDLFPNWVNGAVLLVPLTHELCAVKLADRDPPSIARCATATSSPNLWNLLGSTVSYTTWLLHHLAPTPLAAATNLARHRAPTSSGLKTTTPAATPIATTKLLHIKKHSMQI